MGCSNISHYTLLGVERDASPDQIRRAWKKMSLSLHPDKNEFGAELMKAINEAYDTLSDEMKRREYDREMRAGNSRLEAKLQQVEEELRELKRREQILQSDNEAALASLRAKQQRVDTLCNKLRAKEQERIQQEQDIVELRNQVTFFEAENRGLQLSLDSSQNELDSQIDTIKELKKVMKESKKRERTLQSSIATITIKHEAALAEKQRSSTSQVNKLKKKLRAKEQECIKQEQFHKLYSEQNNLLKELHDQAVVGAASEKEKARNDLKKEKKRAKAELENAERKSAVELVKALAAEKNRAKAELEHVERKWAVELVKALAAEKERSMLEDIKGVFAYGLVCMLIWSMWMHI